MTLPISVILPTRNAMGSIEGHVEEILRWLPEAAQVVVVDSSEDGTLDFLRAKLGHLPQAEFHALPPGLYESWNFAVSRTAGEYVYFSTVGDGIGGDGMRHLLTVAEATGADMVLSPPEMFNETGESFLQPWPIHLFCEELRSDEPCVLEPAEAFILSTTTLPSTVLGSSASNLYRREFLAHRPFPEASGHDADSAWMVTHGVQARIAITKERVARFVVHEKKEAVVIPRGFELDRFIRMVERAPAGLRGSGLPECRQDVLAGWSACLSYRVQQFMRRIGFSARRIDQQNQRVAVLEAEVEKLKAQLSRAQARWKEEQANAANFHAKVLAARRELAEYERRHRRFFGILGLYGAAKVAQLRRLAELFTNGRSGSK